MKINLHIDIQSTPEYVFSWIDDPEKARMWQNGITEGEILLETPGRVGTRFREVISDEGGELEMEGVITAFEPGRLLSMHLESRLHTVDVTHTVEALPSGARCKQDASIHWKFPVNIMIFLQGKKLREKIISQSQGELEKLKQFCEG